VIIGMAKYSGADERGHCFDVKLDETEPLAVRILDNPDTSRASSGAVGHLVRMGDAGLIDVWPVGELALFDTNDWRLPANDYAVVEKAKAIEPLQAGDATVAEVESAIKSLPIPVEKNNMEDEIKQEETTPEVDIAKLVDEAVEAKMKALKEEEPVIKSAPAVKKVTEMGFKEDATKSFIHWMRTGDEVAYKAALQGQTDSEGGYAVPDDFYNKIVEKATLMSFIRQTNAMILQTSLDKIRVPAEGTAVTKFVVTAEEGAVDENEPTLGDVAIEIHRLTKLIKASVEVLADAKGGFETWLMNSFARAKAMAENYYFTVGTGTNMPLGVLAGAGASGITTASATAITAAELVSLVGTLGGGYSCPGCGFLMKSATKWYLAGLTGNPFQFIPTPAGGDFLAMPAYNSDDMEAITNSGKSVVYGNFGYYAVAERQGMNVQRLNELYAANGQVGLLASFRLGGSVIQAEAFKYLAQKA
jgi:HK97 family phage major capsid protein